MNVTTEPRKGIACAGNWTLDLVKVIDQYPPESSIANITAESMGGGGCAFNVTLNLAIFDNSLELYALGVIGSDAYGNFLIDQFRSYPHVHLDQLRRTGEDGTSYTDVFNVASSGRRTFFHYRGANRRFCPDHVDLDKLPVELFHLGYLNLLDAMYQADDQFKTVAAGLLAQVRERGIKTSIDLVSEESSRYRQIVPPALKFTTYCIINDFEAEKLSGIPIRQRQALILGNLKRIATAILAFGVDDLVVIHFPEGAYLLTKDRGEILQPSLDLPESYIVGSTGAGDSFCAGVLYGLYKGWSHEKTLRFAVCAGAMNLSDLTTTGGIRRWQEVFEMEGRFPYRKFSR
jgi:sugar/nucleoside kinase (ribokinase family)